MMSKNFAAAILYPKIMFLVRRNDVIGYYSLNYYNELHKKGQGTKLLNSGKIYVFDRMEFNRAEQSPNAINVDGPHLFRILSFVAYLNGTNSFTSDDAEKLFDYSSDRRKAAEWLDHALVHIVQGTAPDLADMRGSVYIPEWVKNGPLWRSLGYNPPPEYERLISEMVPREGLEPSTYRLQGGCSTN